MPSSRSHETKNRPEFEPFLNPIGSVSNPDLRPIDLRVSRFAIGRVPRRAPRPSARVTSSAVAGRVGFAHGVPNTMR
eukprot:scaffold1222_cov317-Pavlova_lutheri.AAC.25